MESYLDFFKELEYLFLNNEKITLNVGRGKIDTPFISFYYDGVKEKTCLDISFNYPTTINSNNITIDIRLISDTVKCYKLYDKSYLLNEYFANENKPGFRFIKKIISLSDILKENKCLDNSLSKAINVCENIYYKPELCKRDYSEYLYLDCNLENDRNFLECELKENYKNNKGDDNMNSNVNNIFGGNFDFGMVNNDNFRVSHLGLAFKRDNGSYVSYDKEKDTFVEVSSFNMNMTMFKMPKQLSSVCSGDTILLENRPYIIKEIKNSDFIVIDYNDAEVKTIKPVKNMFGFDYVTILVNPLSGQGSGIDPMMLMMLSQGGNINPMMLMLMNQNGGNIDPLTLMMLSQGGNINPMMLMLMNQNGGNIDPLTLMMLSQGGNINPMTLMLMNQNNQK